MNLSYLGHNETLNQNLENQNFSKLNITNNIGKFF